MSGQRDGESLNGIATSRAYGNVNNQSPRLNVGDVPDRLERGRIGRCQACRRWQGLVARAWHLTDAEEYTP